MSHFHYETDPQRIEQQSFALIRELTPLEGLTPEQQQVVMRIVHSTGTPELATQVRFSANACAQGLHALTRQRPILCDVEMVQQGLTKRMLANKPMCFLNDPAVPQLAREHQETRSMASLRFWPPFLDDAIVLIGNAPTLLFRLLEMLYQGAPKPALIIAMPVGFVGAAESKQALWDTHTDLSIECITLLGRQGGSAVAAAACNALLRCQRGEWY